MPREIAVVQFEAMPSHPWYPHLLALLDEVGVNLGDSESSMLPPSYHYYGLTDESELRALAVVEPLSGPNEVIDASDGVYGILYMCTQPGDRSKGYGGDMLKALEGVAVQKGLGCMSVLSTSAAEGFYERHGYERYHDPSIDFTHFKKLT